LATTDRAAADGEDARDVRRKEAFSKNALTDYPGRAKEEDVHRSG
jgi:hypothetical protein